MQLETPFISSQGCWVGPGDDVQILLHSDGRARFKTARWQPGDQAIEEVGDGRPPHPCLLPAYVPTEELETERRPLRLLAGAWAADGTQDTSFSLIVRSLNKRWQDEIIAVDVMDCDDWLSPSAGDDFGTSLDTSGAWN